MRFYNNHLSAPQFIFVRCAEKCDDVDLLQAFGLSAYRRAKWLWGLERYAVLADDGQWMMVADDWCLHSLAHVFDPSGHRKTCGAIMKYSLARLAIGIIRLSSCTILTADLSGDTW